jgi:putative glycosyltransferase
MELSVVTSMYCSAPYLREFYVRMRSAAEKITPDYEIIFVNDGSPDESLETAKELLENDPRVRIIDLSMNFGQHKALMTGLQHARGRRVFLIDSDLEEAPELLDAFSAKFTEEPGCDVVYGIRKFSRGAIFERFTSWAFYVLINILAGLKMPSNITTARLMSLRYVRSLVSFRERELFLGGLCYIAGYKQIALQVEKTSKGKSAYTMRKKIAMLINAVTSFSNKPLIHIFYIGMAMSGLSGLSILYLLGERIFYARQVDSMSMLIVSLWFLGGLIIFFMGVFGIYLSKTFIEIKNRPYTIIREIFERADAEES